MSWDIEAILADLVATVRSGIPEFRSVDEPQENLPPDGPFCLIEYTGGPVDLGNLEDWTHGFRITAGVARNGMIAQERKAVRGFALRIVETLRGNAVLAESDERGAFLTSEAEIGMPGEILYANVPFVGCTVTVAYQTTEGVAHLIED
jgi:hypothetical protein